MRRWLPLRERSFQEKDRVFWLTFKFLLAGVLWIVLTDWLVSTVAQEIIFFSAAQFQLLKGIFFVAGSAAFFFMILDSYSEQLEFKREESKAFFEGSAKPMALAEAGTLKFYDVNDAALALMGFSRSEFFQLTLTDIAAEEETFREVPALIAAGFSSIGKRMLRKSDKTSFPCELIIQQLKQRKAVLIMFTDITRYVEAETQLKKGIRSAEWKTLRESEKLLSRLEEMELRQRQAQNLNEELIHITGELQRVNRDLHAEVTGMREKCALLDTLMSSSGAAAWSFNLSRKNCEFLTPSATALFGIDPAASPGPWFWLDMFPEGKEEMKSVVLQELEDRGFARFSFFENRNDGKKNVTFSLKRYTDNAGVTRLSGMAWEARRDVPVYM